MTQRVAQSGQEAPVHNLGVGWGQADIGGPWAGGHQAGPHRPWGGVWHFSAEKVSSGEEGGQVLSGPPVSLWLLPGSRLRDSARSAKVPGLPVSCPGTCCLKQVKLGKEATWGPL